MHIKALTAAAAVAATMAIAMPGNALAQVDDWDTDTEAGISSDEFRAGLEGTGVFDEWDTNGDNMLSQSGFNEGLGYNDAAFNERFGEDYYNTWDANSDNNIDEDEFYSGSYSGYDADANDMIDEQEFGNFDNDDGDDGFWSG